MKMAGAEGKEFLQFLIETYLCESEFTKTVTTNVA